MRVNRVGEQETWGTWSTTENFNGLRRDTIKWKRVTAFMIHSELCLEYLILEGKGSKVFRNIGRRNRTTRCHVPQDLNPHSNRCDNRNRGVYFSFPDFNLENVAL